MTIYLGERADPETSNPVALRFSGEVLGVEFRLVRDKRSLAELERLANLLRRVPGVAPSLEGIEARDFRVIASMKPSEVLASDASLVAMRSALADAAKPPGSP